MISPKPNKHSKPQQNPFTDERLDATLQPVLDKLYSVADSLSSQYSSLKLPGLDEASTPVVLAHLFSPQLSPVYVREEAPQPSSAAPTTWVAPTYQPQDASSRTSIDLSRKTPSFRALDKLSEHIDSLTSEVKESQLTRKLKKVAKSTKKDASIPKKPLDPVADDLSGLHSTNLKDIDSRRKAREKKVSDLLDSGKKGHISPHSV